MSPVQHQQASNEAETEQATYEKGATRQIRETQESGRETAKSSRSKFRDEPGKPEEKVLPRDVITGRTLVEDGGSCLRCIEKGLRCTLNFVGVEGVAKCAACKRSGAQYCIRQLGLARSIPYEGPPWDNPNYFAIGDDPSPEEMREILLEHYLGKQTYAHDTYLYEVERKQMVLPAFNGSDLPIEQRPKNWKTANWKSVLPIWKNRSLYPRSSLLNRRHKRFTARDVDSMSPRTQRTASVSGGSPRSTSEDTLQYLRIIRKYEPRTAHLKEHMNDALGETW
ncbi:hypothetical protein F5Y13DRAFT_185079 [Hypoxylon sp. FL1857]|nr:hypothetical protein F5Y13DRAFT_185079 [Hypoxylon sp. FL1857]